MYLYDQELVTVKQLVLLAETEKALGVAVLEEMEGRKVQYWLPKSQIDRKDLEAFGQVGDVQMPRWLAEKNDLEYEE
jgi:hypothetical protein